MQYNDLLRGLKQCSVAMTLAGLLSLAPLTGLAAGNSTSPQAEAAFERLVKSYYPLTPNQVHEFKNAAAEQEKANAMPPGPAPAEGTSNIIPVSLKPGQIAPVVRIGQGMITSLVFTDASGKVWPIVSYSVGSPKAFSIAWNKSSGVLMVQGQQLYAQSNMGVMLKGLDIPVMLTLLVGQKHWDYLDYIRVQAFQPSKDGEVAKSVGQAPEYLITLLTGVPPKEAKKLITSNPAVKAWNYKDSMLLLTRATLLSPGWTSHQQGSGPGAENAYELPKASTIMLTLNGKMTNVKITEPAQEDDGSL